MQYEEPKTERRILNIFNELKASNEALGKILKAFERLDILSKFGTASMLRMNERTFILGHEEYKEKMQWFNDFARGNGYEEDIFTDLNDYQTSSDDYDYYYEPKSKRQYKIDEEERKLKRASKNAGATE